MTRKEAIEQMKAGKKVTHRWFSPEEWLMLRSDGLYTTEESAIHRPNEFWGYRDNKGWEDGWSLWEEIIDPNNHLDGIEWTYEFKEHCLDLIDKGSADMSYRIAEAHIQSILEQEQDKFTLLVHKNESSENDLQEQAETVESLRRALIAYKKSRF